MEDRGPGITAPGFEPGAAKKESQPGKSNGTEKKNPGKAFRGIGRQNWQSKFGQSKKRSDFTEGVERKAQL